MKNENNEKTRKHKKKQIKILGLKENRISEIRVHLTGVVVTAACGSDVPTAPTPTLWSTAPFAARPRPGEALGPQLRATEGPGQPVCGGHGTLPRPPGQAHPARLLHHAPPVPLRSRTARSGGLKAPPAPRISPLHSSRVSPNSLGNLIPSWLLFLGGPERTPGNCQRVSHARGNGELKVRHRDKKAQNRISVTSGSPSSGTTSVHGAPRRGERQHPGQQGPSVLTGATETERAPRTGGTRQIAEARRDEVAGKR